MHPAGGRRAILLPRFWNGWPTPSTRGVAVIDHSGFELIAAGTAGDGTARTTLRLPSGDSHRFKLAIEGIRSSVVLQPILGPVAAVIAMQLSYTLGSRSPLHSREGRAVCGSTL